MTEPREPASIARTTRMLEATLARAEAAGEGSQEILQRVDRLVDALDQQIGVGRCIELKQARILIISSSRKQGSGFLDAAEDEIRRLLGGSVSTVTFVPWAMQDHDGYAATVRARLGSMGYDVVSLHEVPDPVTHLESDAQAVFIGGGNTHRLLEQMYTTRVIPPLRDRVRGGMPYMGSSAGSNVAHATVETTNDMPIVDPPLLDALKLLPFALNPHYLDPDPSSTHKGETREQRIQEFLEEHDRPVVGLREGAMLRVEKGSITLVGSGGARLFRRGQDPQELTEGASLSSLLD